MTPQHLATPCHTKCKALNAAVGNTDIINDAVVTLIDCQPNIAHVSPHMSAIRTKGC